MTKPSSISQSLHTLITVCAFTFYLQQHAFKLPLGCEACLQVGPFGRSSSKTRDPSTGSMAAAL